MVKKNKLINLDYFKICNEIPRLFSASLIVKKHEKNEHGKILIVDTCILGDFVVSIHAIKALIERTPKKIDLLVSPVVEPIAERIKGVNKVFIARSSSPRKLEHTLHNSQIKQNFSEYDEIIVLKISKDSLRIIKNIHAHIIKSSFLQMVLYSLHLGKMNLLRKTPKRLRDLFFQIIRERVRDYDFNEIFDFNNKDYKKIEKLDILGKEKNIIIHTGSSWPMNQWFNERWVELLKKINKLGKFRFIFVGREDEEEDFNEIKKLLDFPVYSIIHRANTKDLLLIMRKADYFLGIDSGPRNLANLARLPSITLLGPGPHMFMPWHKEAKVIDKSNGKGIYQRFFYKKNSFISKITVNDVLTEFKKLMKESKKSSY
jgi:ADP-heptose:LPS heptosyltransferase